MLKMDFYTGNANVVLIKIVYFGTQEWIKLKLKGGENIVKIFSVRRCNRTQ